MTTSTPSFNTDNVIEIFSRQPYSSSNNQRFTRLAPEYDGLEMLYSNQSNPKKLFSIKILCWALQSDGEVVGLVPWLDDIVACKKIQDPLNGCWEGYYDSTNDEIFYEAPVHKIIELETAAEHYRDYKVSNNIAQEIPDTIGTHVGYCVYLNKRVWIIPGNILLQDKFYLSVVFQTGLFFLIIST